MQKQLRRLYKDITKTLQDITKTLQFDITIRTKAIWHRKYHSETRSPITGFQIIHNMYIQ